MPIYVRRLGPRVITTSAMSPLAKEMTPIVNSLNTASTKNVVILPTLEAMEAGKVVASAGDGVSIVLASSLIATHAFSIRGISLDVSQISGTTIPVQFSGELNHSSWNFVPSLPVFLGTNGTLTQVYDDTKVFSLIIGMAISDKTIVINMQPPIFFE